MKKGMDQVQEYRRMRQALLISAELKMDDNKPFQETVKDRDQVISDLRETEMKLAALKQKAQVIAGEQERMLLEIIPEKYRERQ